MRVISVVGIERAITVGVQIVPAPILVVLVTVVGQYGISCNPDCEASTDDPCTTSGGAGKAYADVGCELNLAAEATARSLPLERSRHPSCVPSKLTLPTVLVHNNVRKAVHCVIVAWFSWRIALTGVFG